MNNTNLILSNESEKMKNRELLEEYFSHSLEIDLLLRLYPDDEDTLYQIVNLTPEMAQKYEQLFHQPEAFLKLGNRLLVLPVPDEPPAEKPRTKPPAEYDR